ncbi:ribosomal protein S18-alanine N-acetyltransferase [Paraglaciecola aestuariivivens]
MLKVDYLPVSAQYIEPCFTLHKQGQYSPWSQKVFEDCLKPPYFAYAMVLEQQVLGYYVAMQVLDEVTLMDIGVNKIYQNQGYGNALLAHLFEQCQVRNTQQLWLEVRESNKAAIHLYEKHNFILVEQRVGYYPSAKGKEDAFIMCAYLG